MRTFYKFALPAFLRGAACLTLVAVSALCGAKADEATCEPAKLATKDPGLAGRTIKIGQDGEIAPLSMRDPKDVSKLVRLDAELAQGTSAYITWTQQIVTHTWSAVR